MKRRHPGSTRNDALLPYRTLFRSRVAAGQDYFVDGGVGRDRRHRFPPAAGRRGFLGVGEVAAETVPAVHRAAAGGHQQRAALVLVDHAVAGAGGRSEEHTSELQSLMRISYAVFCLNKKKTKN